jgi:putative membrane protein
MPDYVVVSVGGRRKEPSGAGKAAAFVVRWLITAVAVWVAAELIGGITLEGWGSTLAVALILGLLNAYLKPLMVFGSLPALVLTLGFFLILINTALLALTAWIAGKFDSITFAIDGFWSAFWGAVIISLVSFLLTRFVNPRKVAERIG